MLGFCPLASGSKGNAIFIGTKKTRILIDAGISFTSLTQKLQEIDVDVHSLQAVLITHEHADHIQGIPALTRKLNIPILANAATAKGICQTLGIRPRFKIFTTGEDFLFEDLQIHPFSIPHDTLDPVGFLVATNGVKIGFCADLGHATSLVQKKLEGCDYLYVEANHEPSMVHSSARPQVYKQRVLGRQGHLSNQDSADLLLRVWNEKLKHIHLAHLSSECNTEEVALKTVKDALALKKVEISIAYQTCVSKPIFFEK